MKRIILPLLTLLMLVSCAGLAQTTYPISADTIRLGRASGSPTTTVKMTSYKNLAFPGTVSVLAVDNKGVVYQTAMTGGGGSTVNIYNTNGTLTGNRTLTGAGYDWINTGLRRFNVTSSNNNSNNPISLTATQSSGSYAQDAIGIFGTGYTSKGVYVNGTSSTGSIGLSLYGLGSPGSAGLELKGEANGSSNYDIRLHAINGKLQISGLGGDATATEILSRNVSDNFLVWRDITTFPTIYTADGVLTGDRIVGSARHSLSFINAKTMLLSAYDNASAPPIDIRGEQTLSGFNQNAVSIHGVGYENKGVYIVGESLTGDYGATFYGVGNPTASGTEIKGTSTNPHRDIVLNPVNGRMEFKNIPLDNQGDSILSKFEGLLKWKQLSSFPNIYNTNGTLTANRTLDGGSGAKLTFDNLNGFKVKSVGTGSGVNSIGMQFDITGSHNGLLINAAGGIGYNAMEWSGVANGAKGINFDGENTGLNDAGVGISGYSHDATYPDILLEPLNPVLGYGRISITSLPIFPDDAAAGVGGLQTDMLYKTSTGELRIKL